MKRFMLIVLTTLIFLSLTACSGNLGQRLVDLVTTVIVAPFADTEAELSITTTDGRSRINKAHLNPRYSNCHPIKVTIAPGKLLLITLSVKDVAHLKKEPLLSHSTSCLFVNVLNMETNKDT